MFSPPNSLFNNDNLTGPMTAAASDTDNEPEKERERGREEV